MFLVFGSNPLAVRLSRWCAQRQRCILVGLASTLPETEPIEQCEIIALPSAMPLSSLPLDSHTPTAILLIDPNALESEQPLEAIRNHWGDVPILTTLPLQGDGVDLISVDDVSFSAMQDRIRSWERKDGASVLITTSLRCPQAPMSPFSVTIILIPMRLVLDWQCWNCVPPWV